MVRHTPLSPGRRDDVPATAPRAPPGQARGPSRSRGQPRPDRTEPHTPLGLHGDRHDGKGAAGLCAPSGLVWPSAAPSFPAARRGLAPSPRTPPREVAVSRAAPRRTSLSARRRAAAGPEARRDPPPAARARGTRAAGARRAGHRRGRGRPGRPAALPGSPRVLVSFNPPRVNIGGAGGGCHFGLGPGGSEIHGKVTGR